MGVFSITSICCDPVVAQPTTQQSLQLKLVPKQQCSDYLNQGLSVELCATGSCEPCSGYSGSPMLYKYADTYFLVSHEHETCTLRRACVTHTIVCVSVMFDFLFVCFACLLAFVRSESYHMGLAVTRPPFSRLHS